MHLSSPPSGLHVSPTHWGIFGTWQGLSLCLLKIESFCCNRSEKIELHKKLGIKTSKRHILNE